MIKAKILAIGAAIVGGALLVKNKAGDIIATYDTSKIAIRRLLRSYAAQYGLDPDLVDAIGKEETNYTAVTNSSGPDGARGGAYGPTQITEKTARAAGYTGFMEDFNTNPALAAEWTCKILKTGSFNSFDDGVAYWNAGVADAQWAIANTERFGDNYPRYLSALDWVQSNPLA